MFYASIFSPWTRRNREGLKLSISIPGQTQQRDGGMPQHIRFSNDRRNSKVKKGRPWVCFFPRHEFEKLKTNQNGCIPSVNPRGLLFSKNILRSTVALTDPKLHKVESQTVQLGLTTNTKKRVINKKRENFNDRKFYKH